MIKLFHWSVFPESHSFSKAHQGWGWFVFCFVWGRIMEESLCFNIKKQQKFFSPQYGLAQKARAARRSLQINPTDLLRQCGQHCLLYLDKTKVAKSKIISQQSTKLNKAAALYLFEHGKVPVFWHLQVNNDKITHTDAHPVSVEVFCVRNREIRGLPVFLCFIQSSLGREKERVIFVVRFRHIKSFPSRMQFIFKYSFDFL